MKLNYAESDITTEPVTEASLTSSAAKPKGLRGRRPFLLALAAALILMVLWFALKPWLFIVAPGLVTSEPLDMRSPAGAVVSAFYVKRGELVTTGQPLLELKDPALDAQIEALERQLAHMQQFRELGAEISNQMVEKIRVAEEGVKRQDELLGQFDALRKQGVVPTAEMAAVLQAHTAAKMALEQARAELILEQQRQQESRQAGVVTLSRQRMELDLSRFKALREQLIIRAPYDARIVDIQVQVGEQLAPERTLLSLSTRPNPVVVTYLEPKYLDFIEIGQEAVIRFPNGNSLSGQVKEPTKLVGALPKPLSSTLNGDKPMLKVTLTPLDALSFEVEGVPIEVRFDRF